MTEDRTEEQRKSYRPIDAAGFRQSISRDWGPVDRSLVLPAGLAEAAAEHRRKLSAALPGRRIALGAGRAPVRSNDTDYSFRADSDFVWLTGCQAEGAVLVISADGDATLYLRETAGPDEVDFFANARDGELWIGPVPGLKDWSEALQIACRPIEDLPAAVRGAVPFMLATYGVEPQLDALVRTSPYDGDVLRQTLAELRRIKDDWELDQLREAVAASVQAFADVASELPEAIRGGGERWLEGTFDRRARTAGNGPGYASIVAAGNHAPVLHWVRNDGAVREGDVILLDAGVETRTLYTADVTRTFPATGEFTPAQRQVHDLVHKAHLAALEAVRPGSPYRAFQYEAMRVLIEGLKDWGVLDVSLDEALGPDGQQHRRYVVCGLGHFIGLDVHDCDAARPETYFAADLEVGMALAVEPGLYFHPNDETVPPELRGIGVRIEDNVVVHPDRLEVLTEALPIDTDGLEQWTRAQLSR
ncbi:MAG TPA: aminopeptidase P family protein [Kribbella sp.]|uniref:aminopeptidase P family protein n=1 Tax=Kribbella sp. TaxID=1871183 RepID=UPI002D76C84C|nr:aminopeptidase P family protein [Kribbella sp.]HET6294597.1 aminopeptidase P family protein [Kribbella sp.]